MYDLDEVDQICFDIKDKEGFSGIVLEHCHIIVHTLVYVRYNP